MEDETVITVSERLRAEYGFVKFSEQRKSPIVLLIRASRVVTRDRVVLPPLGGVSIPESLTDCFMALTINGLDFDKLLFATAV